MRYTALGHALAVALLASGARALVAQSGPAAARVWSGTITLPTYAEGAPDPNAPFDVFTTPGRPNYPYTIRDELTNRRAPKAWRALFLENEYLRCSVLPDLGGHLYSCTDKANGVEMFYANSAMKFSNIAYRGSWAAFGIEFNFPVSHNWMTTSPVDFATGTSEDGSAWIEVGNVDRPYGMQWTVRLTLQPGHARLDQHTRLYNRSDVRRRFYWWTNAAVRAYDDTRILYPMKYTASHGFADVDTWPVDSKGTDNSILRNHVFGPVSRFAHASREGFMGVWNPRTNSGVAHYAAPEALPAKKIWSWGVDADALDWRRQLSDDSSAYVEIQAGLFRDQETYGWLQPQDAVEFDEAWMPLRLGGLTRMKPNGAIAMDRTAASGDSSDIRLALQLTRRGGDVSVDAGALHRVIDARPDSVYRWTIRVREGSPLLHVVVRDRAGILLDHTEGRFDFLADSLVRVGKQVARVWPTPAERDGGDWLSYGEDREVNGDVIGALDAYRAGLARSPRDRELLRANTRLAVTLGRYGDGDALATSALAMQPADHEMAYYRGLARLALHDTARARLDFEQAGQYGPLRGAAQLAQLRLGGALAHDARASLNSARMRDLASLTLLRGFDEARGGGAGDARQRFTRLASEAATEDPTGNVARWLRVAAGGSDPTLLSHLAGDAERVLDIAGALLDVGASREAAAFLATRWPDDSSVHRENGMPKPDQHPLVAYYRAFATARSSGDAGPALDRARAFPLTYVFPHGERTREVLEWALGVRPDDQSARYLLGMMALQRGESKMAIAMWDSVRATRRDIPGLHRNLGYALLLVGDTARSLDVLRDGTREERANPAVWTGLDSLLALTGASAAERAQSLDRYPDRAAMPTALVYRYAGLLADAGRFDDAESLFADRWFSRVEGGTNPRGVWLDVRTKRALATMASDCRAARRIVASLGRPVPRMAFTRDGLAPFLTSKAMRARLAQVETKCGGAR